MYSKKTMFEKIAEKLHGTSKQKKVQDFSMEQFSYAAYIKAWQLIREKRTMLLANLQKEEDFAGNENWYDVPCYLECICEKVQKLIGGIAKIDYRNITVTVLYQIPPGAENEWKSVQGDEQPCKIKTEEFMKNQDILFSKLVNKDILHFYQDNNISGQNKEEPGENNGMKRNDTVTFGIRTDFEDTRDSYVNGILVISIYKQDLSEIYGYCESIGKTFENILIYSVLPYFIQLIQTELGTMYLQETGKTKK